MNAISRPQIVPASYLIAEPVQRRWYVLAVDDDERTLSRLRRQALDARCLMLRVRKSRLSHEFKEERMFPGYLLIAMPDSGEGWNLVRDTEGVFAVLPGGPDQPPVPLPENAVQDLFALVHRSGGDFDYRGFGIVNTAGPKDRALPEFEEGTPIRVKSGPFEGYYGKWLKRVAGTRVAALLTMFGRETACRLDESQIQLVDG